MQERIEVHVTQRERPTGHVEVSHVEIGNGTQVTVDGGARGHRQIRSVRAMLAERQYDAGVRFRASSLLPIPSDRRVVACRDRLDPREM